MEFMSTLSPIMTILVDVGIVTVIWAGGMQSIRGGVTVGQIVAFINYLQTTLGPLTIMVMLANVLAAGSASAERINQVLETTPEVQDAPHPLQLPERTEPRIVFEQVSFHYNGASDRPVLQGVDLVAEPGQTIAILGATGSGKSSLINLIPRFYDVSAGRVRLNGVDIRQVPQDELLAQVGIVPQETVLFSGTVRDNIRYGRPEASDEEVVAAAKAAQAHKFILKLPDGYDTHIEERGVNLSGGQKQRIAIARALLVSPGVLILDDSTSAVDVDTEIKIQDALEERWADTTSIIIAQRINSVLNADQIMILDGGRIIETGTHRELMRTSAIYQDIYRSQFGTESLDPMTS
jgi:ATP-binding cassette subfamily B protein